MKLVFAFRAFRMLNTPAHISFKKQQLTSEAHFNAFFSEVWRSFY